MKKPLISTSQGIEIRYLVNWTSIKASDLPSSTADVNYSLSKQNASFFILYWQNLSTLVTHTAWCYHQRIGFGL